MTVREINSLRRKFCLDYDRTYVVQVKDVLSGQGTLRSLQREELVRFALFVPDSIRHLADMRSEILSADATHRLNPSGYVQWRAMAANDSGFCRPIFYALLPNENGASYRRLINAMKDKFSSTSIVKMIVVDRSMAQLNAF